MTAVVSARETKREKACRAVDAARKLHKLKCIRMPLNGTHALNGNLIRWNSATQLKVYFQSDAHSLHTRVSLFPIDPHMSILFAISFTHTVCAFLIQTPK